LAHPAERVFKHHGTYMSVSVPKDNANTNVWIPPIQRTISTEGTGIAELADAIAKHSEYLRQTGDWSLRERIRLEVELEALIRESLLNRFREDVPQKTYEEVLEKVIQRDVSPWEAAKILLNGRLK
ncbi:MAG TPA: hypothetical protein PLF42_17110, partial [Anaerolineales bacterium]|nr:hypothetical protein [Anaerolineales bacterium]